MIRIDEIGVGDGLRLLRGGHSTATGEIEITLRAIEILLPKTPFAG